MEAAPLAALHVHTFPGARVPAALARRGLDGRHLARTPGLTFFRLLGTARGRSFGPWAPTRWAAFTVWTSRGALEAFRARSPVARAWARASEAYTLLLRPTAWHGAWAGQAPFRAFAPEPRPAPGPVCVLTRAAVRVRHLAAFRRAAARVEQQLAGEDGLVASVGAGEVPWLQQATFSLWTDARAVQRFAYAGGDHPGVVRRTREEGWYREELFARFEPLGEEGTWDGRRPLAEARARARAA